MVSHGAPTVAVDYLMSVQRAAQVMTEQHLDAVPVTKNAKVWLLISGSPALKADGWCSVGSWSVH